ncbi:hypothetical protein JOF47_003758 [Paeniglutamicibacter kerguelensis]|uniref:Uncharacterized protein n=1 Tax=Paeniglutamicibacter kerguelensis TaxID=254788 RepID=A0ABS4XIG1_9MICC|nr:hypothetical protein [Paeniglutamicibacter kerguelensis]
MPSNPVENANRTAQHGPPGFQRILP